MEIEIVEWHAADVLRNRHEFGTIYRHAFAGPPYWTSQQVAQQFVHETLPLHTQRAGFRCIVARNTQYGIPVGFAYGYTGEEGQWWREVVANALPPAVAAHWMLQYFEFVEFAVSPSAQGKGIGGRIHDALVAGISQPRALLSTHATDTPARCLYVRRGWTTLLDALVFPGSTTPFAIMGLELNRASMTFDPVSQATVRPRRW